MKRAGCLLVLLALGAVGCGSTCVVSGEVTYEGEPVQDGMLTFKSADGSAPAVGAVIRAGRYTTSELRPGKLIATATAVKKIGPISSEDMARRAKEAAARGDHTGLIEPADLIPANAPGNNVE